MAETRKSMGIGLRAQRTISLVITVLGVVLLAYMIAVEDEPGALSLALLLGGVVWFYITRARIRATNTKEVLK